MDDRELLKAAAKAAGVGPVLCYESARNCLHIGERTNYSLWRPLTDDGDALRLAVRLGIAVSCRNSNAQATYPLADGRFFAPCDEPADADPYAATRRAIVRAAAEIGRMR